MKKATKRIGMLFVLVCALVFTLSLGVLCACNAKPTTAGTEANASGAWYYGAAAPADALGQEGDYYLNTKTLASYQKTSNGWSTVSLESGEWYYGNGAPADGDGNATDFYLDTANGDLYHKTEEGWGEPVLQLFGKNGRDGVLWFSGNQDPNTYGEGDTTLKDAIKGDFYLEYPTFTVYQLIEKEGKLTWEKLGSLKGEKGEKGDDAELPEAEKVTVTYDVNGGDPLESAEIQVEKGNSIEALPIPKRTNYTFLGWFTGTGVNDGQVTTVTPISRDVTLVAHWVFSGRYTFDSFTMDDTDMSFTEATKFYLGTIHNFVFHAHGADDSFLQIWYSKDGVEGEALWNKPIGGKVYTDGFAGNTVLGEHGEMTLTVSSAEFKEEGTYFVWMEADAHFSAKYTFTVTAKPEITPSEDGSVKLEVGKIESPSEAKEVYLGEVQTYQFILSHNALKARAISKPRIILGMNISFPGSTGTYNYNVTENQDSYDNGQKNPNPETKPYQYTFVYGEENNRWFGNDPNRPIADWDSSSAAYAYKNNQAGIKGSVRITNFELNEGYVSFTLEMNITGIALPSGCKEAKIEPTIVYELDTEEETTTRFDVIGNQKLEGDAAEKTTLATNYARKRVTPKFSVGTSFLNTVVNGTITFTYDGSPKDFEFNGLYLDDVEVKEDEVYTNGIIKLAYRYEGVTEQDGTCTATIDVYAYEVLAEGNRTIRVDYTILGKGETASHTSSLIFMKDPVVRLEFDEYLLEAWHTMVNDTKWAGSENKKVQFAQELVNRLWNNRESLNLQDYELISGTAAGSLWAEVTSKTDNPFATVSYEAANAEAEPIMSYLLGKYDGASRLLLYNWMKRYFGKQSFDYSQFNTLMDMYSCLVFFGFCNETFGFGSVPPSYQYVSREIFGSVGNLAYFIQLVFDNVGPEDTAALVDWLIEDISESDSSNLNGLGKQAYDALVAAYTAYHADESSADALAAYVEAANEYLMANEYNKYPFAPAPTTLFVNAQKRITEANASLAVLDPENKAALDKAIAALNDVRSFASRSQSGTLTYADLATYTEKINTLYDLLDEYTRQVGDFDQVEFCKNVWTEAQTEYESKQLNPLQYLAYEALQSYRTKGEKDGATTKEISDYVAKTRLYINAKTLVNDNTLKTDIQSYLRSLYPDNKNGFEAYRNKFGDLFAAYDGILLNSSSRTYSSNVFTLQRFAEEYYRAAVEGKKEISATDETSLILLDNILEAYKANETYWKYHKEVGSVAVFLMEKTPYKAAREKWAVNHNDTESAEIMVQYGQDAISFLLAQSFLIQRFSNYASLEKSAGVAVKGAVCADALGRLIELLKQDEYTQFIKDQKTALQVAAGGAYEAFAADSKNNVYGGWHGAQFSNQSVGNMIKYEFYTWESGVYKRKYVDQTIADDATSGVRVSGFELLRVVYQDYTSEDPTYMAEAKHNEIGYTFYRILDGCLSSMWYNGWGSRPDGQPYDDQTVTVLTKSQEAEKTV